MTTTTTAVPPFTPATFALHAVGGDAAGIVAWGMTLPDGSAVAVGWRRGHRSTIATCANAEQAAQLHNAALIWTSPPPATTGRKDYR